MGLTGLVTLDSNQDLAPFEHAFGKGKQSPTPHWLQSCNFGAATRVGDVKRGQPPLGAALLSGKLVEGRASCADQAKGSLVGHSLQHAPRLVRCELAQIRSLGPRDLPVGPGVLGHHVLRLERVDGFDPHVRVALLGLSCGAIVMTWLTTEVAAASCSWPSGADSSTWSAAPRPRPRHRRGGEHAHHGPSPPPPGPRPPGSPPRPTVSAQRSAAVTGSPELTRARAGRGSAGC